MLSSSGQESSSHGHGVHVCSKCGWPFPNPHPSARHRRAHKKLCGTIDGYKLLDSLDPPAAAAAAALSDEDHLSDEDPKTPSPKPAEKFDIEKCGGGSGGGGGGSLKRSNRSEDELYTDAVTEFNDTGLVPGTEEHLEDARPPARNVEKVSSRNLTMFYSFKDNAVADVIEQPRNSTDGSTMPNPEVHENTTNFSGSNLEFQAHVSSSTEEPATTISDDKNEKACALYPIKPETPSSESRENMMINASADVAEGSMAYAGQETDAKGDGKVTSDRATDKLLRNEYADQPSKTESKSQEIQEMTSHLLSTDGVVLSKEDHGDATAAKMTSGDLIPGTESVEHMNIIDTVPMNVNAKEDLDFASSVNPIEGYSGKGEANDNVHELSVPADIPVVDHAEIKLEGFKDPKGVKLNNSIDVDSLEIIKDKRDDAEYPVSVENFTSFQPVQFIEVPKVSASDLHVSEDNLTQEGPMVENQSTEGKSDVPLIKLTCNEKSDELGIPVTSETVEMKESLPVSSVGKEPTSYVRDDSLHKDFPDTAVNVLNDVDTMIAHEDANAVVRNDAGNHKKAISQTNDVAGNDENKSAEEENNAKNRTTFSESATSRPEVLVKPTTNVHESNDAGDHGKGKVENSAVMGVGRGEEPVEEKLSASENATSLHKLEVIDDDVMDMTVMDMTAMKLPEAKLGNLNAVSNTQDGLEQLEISGNNKAQEKQVDEQDRGVELSERTSEDHAAKVPPVSPFGTESSIPSSVVNDDDHTGHTVEFGRGDSVTNLSLQGESIDNQHQLGASPVDVSVDAMSQTDSLEGNWGSISVLSTQSDAPFVDAETAKGATERQSSSKSDVFEAPSFMTLVESGSGANHKAAAPQTQTTQNMQQQNAASSQAGWFPSLTHVVNESEGRKKNEEIIAKVTNWSTGKQHTPLKNLLGEAKNEMRPKSPNPKENQSHAIWKDETASKDNGAAVTTVSAILGPEDRKREMAKEGNSPARYPADIKREKRKVKGKPYWAQFMCCSSVN